MSLSIFTLLLLLNNYHFNASREGGKKGKNDEGKEAGEGGRGVKQRRRKRRMKEETLMISLKNFQRYNSILQNISIIFFRFNNILNKSIVFQFIWITQIRLRYKNVRNIH